MRIYRSNLSILLLMLTSGCTHVTAGDQTSSICSLDEAAIVKRTKVRVKAIYSPSSMHGDVLQDVACPKKRISTYGFDQAKGDSSAKFNQELQNIALSISEVEYEIDVSGSLERDADGVWLKALVVHNFRRLRK